MMEPNTKAETPQARRRRKRRDRVRIRAYQIPGYGRAYRWFQIAIHARGRCVLRRDQMLHDDGRQTWRCRWCGHMSTYSAYTVRMNRARATGDQDEQLRVMKEQMRRESDMESD